MSDNSSQASEIEVIICNEPFDPAKAYELLDVNPQTGAVASFIGQVRGQESVVLDADGDSSRELKAMQIEHYPGMTEQVIHSICQKAFKRWKIQNCLVLHRVGVLNVSEPIVLVLVASAHRSDAFSACEFIMDFLKTEAPFWKKALFEHSEQWIDSRQSDLMRKESWQD